MTILRFRPLLRLIPSRRAATPPAAPQPPAGVPHTVPAAVPSAEIVCLADRRASPLPWVPIPPFVAAAILGTALASATTAYVAADLFTVPSRLAVAAFDFWSA